MNRDCKARQFSDQMYCHKCNLTWDVNDPEPPECGSGKQWHTEVMRENLKRLKRSKGSVSGTVTVVGVKVHYRCENVDDVTKFLNVVDTLNKTQ